MSRGHFLRAKNRGFTLAELAIVLVIVALLVGSLLVPLSTQIDSRNLADTRRALAEIRETILGYAVVNGRLPCPALANVASGAAGAGLEGTRDASGCTNIAGVVPWATLGVAETDAWGRRYSYRVTRAFTKKAVPPPDISECPVPLPPLPQSAAFALCSPGDMSVLVTVGGAKIATAVPAVVVSHGKNGKGAYTVLGTQTASGADADEQDNQLTGAGNTMANPDFVYKPAIPGFDDEVVWIAPGVLFSRMIRAGKLP
jgi:prepilin-type N-terminal cleavage/methylation domain-containing protein